MRKAIVEVFSLDELSDEAKERAYRDWNADGVPYPFAEGARRTMEAFENEFGVKVRNWEYGSGGYRFRLDTSSIDDDVLALSGNRARAWFWNAHGDALLVPKTRRFTRGKDGKLAEAAVPGTVKYVSKVSFERAYEGTCPLTGWCFDSCALDPISRFCFGVEWDDGERKHVKSKVRTLDNDNGHTVESLLHDSVDALFRGLMEDCAYQESMEAFEDACEANAYEFTGDGAMWLRKEES